MHHTTASTSQLLSPRAYMMQSYIGGNPFAATEVIQITPTENAIGALWSKDIDKRRNIILTTAEDLVNERYDSKLAGVKELVEDALPNYKKDRKQALEHLVDSLKEGIRLKTAEGTKNRSAKLWNYEGRTVLPWSTDQNPVLQEAGMKQYLHLLASQVVSLNHANIRGKDRRVTIVKKTIDHFSDGQTPFLSDDFIYHLAQLKNQEENSSSKIMTTHFMSRYVAAVLHSYAAASKNSSVLPIKTDDRTLGEVALMYFLPHDRKDDDNDTSMFDIDRRLLLSGGVSPSLIENTRNYRALRLIQRNRFLGKSKYMLEDRILKNALVDKMEEIGIQFVGYTEAFLDQKHAAFSELWLGKTVSYELVFGAEFLPPLIIRRELDPKNKFDFYKANPNITYTLEPKAMIRDRNIMYKGPLWSVASGHIDTTAVYMPDLNKLKFVSEDEKRLVESASKARLDSFLNYAGRR